MKALLSFKALQDAGNPDAQAIWRRYQDSGNERVLNIEISKLVSSKAKAKPRSDRLPPGGVDSFPDAGKSSKC